MESVPILVLLAAAIPLAAAGCLSASDCSDRGSCVNGVCQCYPGFLLPSCTPFCVTRANCSNHGNCVAANGDAGPACVCDSGWGGPRCAVAACKLACGHGGTPNAPDASCTHCVKCAMGWGGTECRDWDPAVLPSLAGEVHHIANQSAASLAALQAKYHTIPGSVGWGVNIWTGALTGLPIVKLSYGNKNKVWNGFTTPEQAIFTPFELPAGIGASYVFETIGDFDSMKSGMSAQNLGEGGTFAWSRKHVFDSAFKATAASGAGFDPSLTVTLWSYALYEMELPANPVTQQFEYEIDDYALAVVNVLPPYYNATTAPIFEAFVERWGTSYTKKSTNGGLVYQHSSYPSWFFAQRNLSAVPGEDPRPGFADTELQAFAQTEFLNSTRLPVPAWEPHPADPNYLAHIYFRSVGCEGGNPSACNDGADLSSAWLPTVAAAPVPVAWELGAIDQLITDDPAVSTAFAQAIDNFVKTQEATWRATDICPLSCHGAGACDATAHADECTCSAGGHAMGTACSACQFGWSNVAGGCDTPVCTEACGDMGCDCGIAGQKTPFACLCYTDPWPDRNASAPLDCGSCNVKNYRTITSVLGGYTTGAGNSAVCAHKYSDSNSCPGPETFPPGGKNVGAMTATLGICSACLICGVPQGGGGGGRRLLSSRRRLHHHHPVDHCGGFTCPQGMVCTNGTKHNQAGCCYFPVPAA